MREIPDDISKLKSLKILSIMLYLEDNYLKNLPESIGELQILSLINNSISSPLGSIGQLENLRDLNLNRYNFDSLLGFLLLHFLMYLDLISTGSKKKKKEINF